MIDTPVMTKQRIDTESTKINLTVAETARIFGKSEQWVRIVCQRGLVPWGYGVILTGNKYTYFISAPLVYKAIGQPLPSQYKEKEELQGENRYTVITDPTEMKAVFKTWEVRRNA